MEKVCLALHKFNKAQTSHRHATDVPPTYHRRILYVISSKSGQRVGRLSTDSRPTVDQLSTNALADVLADASVGSDSLPLPKGEMHQFFRFLSDQTSAITSFLEKEINVNRGLRLLLNQKADHYRKKIQLLTCMCKDFVMFPSFTEPEETYLQFSEVQIETTSNLEIVMT